MGENLYKEPVAADKATLREFDTAAIAGIVLKEHPLKADFETVGNDAANGVKDGDTIVLTTPLGFEHAALWFDGEGGTPRIGNIRRYIAAANIVGLVDPTVWPAVDDYGQPVKLTVIDGVEVGHYEHNGVSWVPTKINNSYTVGTAGGGGDVTTAQINAVLAAQDTRDDAQDLLIAGVPALITASKTQIEADRLALLDALDPARNIGPLTGYLTADSPVTPPAGEKNDWVFLKDAVTFGATAYPAGTALRLTADGDTDWSVDEALTQQITSYVPSYEWLGHNDTLTLNAVNSSVYTGLTTDNDTLFPVEDRTDSSGTTAAYKFAQINVPDGSVDNERKLISVYGENHVMYVGKIEGDAAARLIVPTVGGIHALHWSAADDTWRVTVGSVVGGASSAAGTAGVKGDTGDDGKSAYQSAIDTGTFTGTEAEWAASLEGADAYQLAVDGGYTGDSLEDWLLSQKGDPGQSAYQAAQAGGFTGTNAEFQALLNRKRRATYTYTVRSDLAVGTVEETIAADLQFAGTVVYIGAGTTTGGTVDVAVRVTNSNVGDTITANNTYASIVPDPLVAPNTFVAGDSLKIGTFNPQSDPVGLVVQVIIEES